MKLNVVQHIGIVVRDLERSLAFYQDLTGGTVLFTNPMHGRSVGQSMQVENPSLRFAMLQIGNTILELIAYSHPESRPYDRRNPDIGINHLAFQVDDIGQAYRQLREKGVEFVHAPYTFTPQDGALDVVGSSFAYFKDPDGLNVEIFQPATQAVPARINT